ncbi:MAG: OsmC family protein [Paludibacteraceae bacterium]|nr:OsmC family protein [Paludibacteraceae bacterium]
MSEKHVIKTQWKGDLTFQAEIDNHKLIMDAPVASGSKDLGPGPKKLQLASLSGCTGMDIVSILKKMRVEIKALDMEVQGELTDEHPVHYKSMHVVYTITGTDLPVAKIEKAVRMSEETYCGVGALYRKAIPVTSEIKIVEG